MTRLASAVTALGITLLVVEAPQAQPTFSARRESVRVDVLVSANGRPLLGLQPSDFEVRDNGVAQRVELASFEAIPINVILAFDMSQSVAGDRLTHLQRAGAAVLRSLQPRDRAALVTFNEAVARPAALSHDVETVRTALDAADGVGETSLIDGLYASLLLGDTQAGRSLVIVFSDGLDTRSWLTADQLRATARSSDAVVYAVTAGKAEERDLLDDLTEATGGALFQTESSSALEATFVRIVDEFRHRYLVSYSPTGVDASGWHRLDVRVRARGANVRARPGYFKERDASQR